MKHLLIATSNIGKFREFADLLKNDVEQVSSFADIPGIVVPEENGSTFEENAIIKARSAWIQAGIPSIADDSGLEVDALGGKPGILSARYAGEVLNSDLKNNEKLLKELLALPLESRTARFVCCIAFCRDEGECIIFSGTLSGLILQNPRGDKGFGYDPLFLVPEYGKTLAELSLSIKNRISHRAKAFALFREYLTSNR